MSKKSAKNTREFRQYSVGDHVLGKVRGYPPWPGMVVDPSSVPQAVLNEQPPGKKSTFHCVLFFPMGDYSWLHPKDLSSLKRHEIEAFLADQNKKRNGDLRDGYRIALDPTAWLENNEKGRQAAAQQEQEAEEHVDQLDSHSEEGDADTKKGKGLKKRKRDDEASKKTTKKVDSTDSKRKTKKSKSVVESEDEHAHEDDEDAGPSKSLTSPPAKKTRRDNKADEEDDSKISDPQAITVRDWRHKLQKTFLSNKTMPKPEVMPEVDSLFILIENYNDMTIEQLQFSKIGKVMRHITAVPDERIPRDDEFKFRARAKKLVEKWHEILNANKAGAESPAETTGHFNGKSEEKVTEEVTQGTKNLALNGGDEGLVTSEITGQDALVAGDTSMLSEA